MSRAITRRDKRGARHKRVRLRVQGNSGRPRMSVFRSLQQIYAQVIDDTTGHTLAAASSLGSKKSNQSNGLNKTQVARLVGTEIAERTKAAGIGRVVFDRGGYRYHGRIKALAEAAREGGLEF
ncbi:MAG: 50S ribosomal protein L18 [Dehalococcoidia bacterium]